jgi:hypothetical protein
MRDSNLPESELLKTVLQPLLEDFQYWFASSGAKRPPFWGDRVIFWKRNNYHS